MQWHLSDFENVGFGFFAAAVASLSSYALSSVVKRLSKREVAYNSKEYPLANEKETSKPRRITKQEQAHYNEMHKQNIKYIKLGVVSTLSVVLVGFSLYLIVFSANQDNVHWGQSTIALISGFWLKALTDI